MSKASKQQKAKQRQKKQQQKSQKRRKTQQAKKLAPAASVAVRQRAKIAKQQPEAWEGELPEDVAVLSATTDDALGDDVQRQVTAVREALELALNSQGDEALARVSTIPRNSSLSDWRLFVRGLVSWMSSDHDEAATCWKRLDPERRPGRMATVLKTANRAPLDEMNIDTFVPKSTDEATNESGDVAADDDAANDIDWFGRLDRKLLAAAKLLRQVRFKRVALRIARRETAAPSEIEEALVSPEQVIWLREFSRDFASTEPEFVQALQLCALRRAFASPYVDVFEKAATYFQGPSHDPKNTLLRFFFQLGGRNSQGASTYLEEYLKIDLPANQELSDPVRSAILSQACLNDAMSKMAPTGGFPFGFGRSPDSDEIAQAFRRSIKAYPPHREAYVAYLDWVEAEEEKSNGFAKSNRKQWASHRKWIMEQWYKGRPNDIEPRLWLVEDAMDRDSLADAEPHVKWLSSTRHDDPLVRAMPWKWELLQAMQFARRKKSLAQAEERLDAAEQLWPVWLAKDWLCYLRAALALRRGDTAAYEEQHAAACQQCEIESGSLLDSCMSLSAAQRMRVPAAELKPFRAVIDAAAKQPRDIETDDLVHTGAFMWDLHRSQMLYPAYRGHGSKLGKELVRRLKTISGVSDPNVNDATCQYAILWCSQFRFWDTNVVSIPKVVEARSKQEVLLAGAILHAHVNYRYGSATHRHSHLLTFVREQAPQQSDPFYRHWLAALVDKAEEQDAASKRDMGMFGGMFDRFADMFGFEDGGYEYEDDFECNCPDCRAARANEQQATLF